MRILFALAFLVMVFSVYILLFADVFIKLKDKMVRKLNRAFQKREKGVEEYERKSN